MFTCFLVFCLTFVGVASAHATPAATPTVTEECSHLVSAQAPWSAVLESSAIEGAHCLQPVAIEDAPVQVASRERVLPVISTNQSLGGLPITVTFSGHHMVPHIVEVSLRFGDDRSEWEALTTCLGEDVVRLDGVPKNETCEVIVGDGPTQSINFAVPERFHSSTSITVVLQVEWYDPLPVSIASKHMEVWATDVVVEEG